MPEGSVDNLSIHRRSSARAHLAACCLSDCFSVSLELPCRAAVRLLPAQSRLSSSNYNAWPHPRKVTFDWHRSKVSATMVAMRDGAVIHGYRHEPPESPLSTPQRYPGHQHRDAQHQTCHPRVIGEENRVQIGRRKPLGHCAPSTSASRHAAGHMSAPSRLPASWLC